MLDAQHRPAVFISDARVRVIMATVSGDREDPFPPSLLQTLQAGTVRQAQAVVTMPSRPGAGLVLVSNETSPEHWTVVAPDGTRVGRSSHLA